MEVPPTVAERLLFDGATCICLGVPVGTEIGIDLKSWTTAQNFRGIKMIPPGIHFIYFRNSHGDSSPRTGFMYNFKKSEILVKKWNEEKLELIDDVEKNDTWRENLRELDRFLGAYPFELYMKWKNLSSKITPQLLNKMLPSCNMIHSALELSASGNKGLKEGASGNINTNSVPKNYTKKFFFGEDSYEDLLPELKAVEGTEIRFSTIPEKWYPEGCTPSEITKHSLDFTYVFEQIVKQHECKMDVIGEMQFAFVCFFVGLSLEAFDHWKKLIYIFCSCEEAILKHNDLFCEFLSTLNHELNEVQEDFLVDIVAGSNFVYKLLRKLFRTLHMSDVSGRLGTRAKRFQELLTEKFMWDFSDVLEEEEEDQPVIVEV